MTIHEWQRREKLRVERIAYGQSQPMTPAQLRQWFALRESRAS